MIKEYLVKCKNCGKEFFVNEEESKFPIKGDKYFCCRSCANTRHHSPETKMKISIGIKNSEIYKINNAKAILNRKHHYNTKTQYFCKNCGKEIDYPTRIGKYIYCSEKCANDYLSLHNHGGYRIGSTNKWKNGIYQGIRCDSSWELAYLVYNLEHNIPIERCKEIRTYKLNNKIYKYYPDFIVNNKEIIEIKGYEYNTEKVKQKHLQNPDIKILYKNDIEIMLKYTISKYGNNFWEVLYNK